VRGGTPRNLSCQTMGRQKRIVEERGVNKLRESRESKEGEQYKQGGMAEKIQHNGGQATKACQTHG